MKRYSTLFLILVLLDALTLSQTASADSSTSPAAPTFPQLSLRAPEPEEAEEFEAEEGEESEYEECEATAEEFEFEEEEFEEVEEFEFEAECGEEEAKSNGAFVTAPPACLVRRAESSITMLPASDRVVLTVHYLTYSPSTVTVGLKLKDHKGTLTIEHATRHLGAKGVLRLTTKLGDAVMERAAKATEFDVSLRAANTPGFCGGLLEQQLKSKHPVGKARVYTGPAGN
jgi:hypothetical protein